MLSDAAGWNYPDCSGSSASVAAPAAGGELVASIHTIKADATLSDLLAGSAAAEDENEDEEDARDGGGNGCSLSCQHACLPPAIRCIFFCFCSLYSVREELIKNWRSCVEYDIKSYGLLQFQTQIELVGMPD
ncbi:unnamed protein product [Urochloa humidicola]